VCCAVLHAESSTVLSFTKALQYTAVYIYIYGIYGVPKMYIPCYIVHMCTQCSTAVGTVPSTRT